MHSEQRLVSVEVGRSFGPEDLAEGLMLVHAATLKAVRLQLALQRHDRRFALEAVDDLIDLDRRIQDSLSNMSAIRNDAGLRDRLDTERIALNHEKLGLAAGISGHELRTPPPLSTDADVRNLFVEGCPGEIDVAPASNRRRPWLFAALLLGLVIAVALIGSAMLYFRVDWTEAVKLFDARF